MNLYNIRVSLSEMSDKKLTLFTIFNFFWGVPLFVAIAKNIVYNINQNDLFFFYTKNH